MPRMRREWSPEQIREAVTMRAAGSSWKTIGYALGRDPDVVKSKLASINASTVASANNLLREGLHTKTERALPMHTPSPPITPELEEQRSRNYAAQAERSLTASVFGDPPPGRSALDQRKKQQQQA